MMRCVFCDGKSNKGAHDVCWKEFKGFMLNDRPALDLHDRDEAYDEPNQTRQSGKDVQGRNVVGGRILPVLNIQETFGSPSPRL